VINSIKPRRWRKRFAKNVVPLAKRYGARTGGGCIDERGQEILAEAEKKKARGRAASHGYVTRKYGVHD